SGLAATALLAVAALSTGLAIHQSGAAARLRQEQQRTEEALGEAQRVSANLALVQGQNLCEQGEIGRGMLWLGRSLEIARPDAARLGRTIRVNLAGWHRQLSPLRAFLQHQDTVRAVAFSPDGKTILTGSGPMFTAFGKAGPGLRGEARL